MKYLSKRKSILYFISFMLGFITTVFIIYALINYLFMPKQYECITVNNEKVNATHIYFHKGYVLCEQEDGTVTEIISYREV